MNNIVHLRTHSYYSFLEGLPSPFQLAGFAAALGMPALGLTDRNGMSGAIEFYDACTKAGIKPILGLEFDVKAPARLEIDRTGPGRLVVLAMDLSGWESLCRISSRLLSDPAVTNPSLTSDTLAQYSSGLICLSGGRRSLAASYLRSGNKKAAYAWLEGLYDLFPGRLYAELQLHDTDDLPWVKSLGTIAAQLDIPVVGTHTVDYLHREQSSLQRVVSAIRMNTPLSSLPESACALPESYFLTGEELAQKFKEIPQALAAIQEIVERCDLKISLGKPIFPAVDLPEGSSAIDAISYKAQVGAIKIYGGITPEIRARLDYELKVIADCGYASLFLIVEDILGFARKKGIPISARGSVASSLVAHCLGITSPDPLRLNLYFERFLNPVRASPPDIDVDLCSRRRDRLIDYVYDRFGRDKVAMVATVNTFRRRSALREVAKAYGIKGTDLSRLADSLPERWYGSPDLQKQDVDPFTELSQQYPDALHQSIFNHAKALLGVPDHLSVHPGGVVIAPGEMHEIAPTQIAAKGVRTTQFDMLSVARLGLVKIDLLGIRGLTVLGDVAEGVVGVSDGDSTVGAAIKWLEHIPEDDSETGEAVRNGQTIGCFQIESPGMRATLKEVQAKSVDDIMVALALYRPGPLTGGMKDAFVHRRRGDEPTTLIHPALAPVLQDTYGVILYQEQVLRIANELAGLSLADSDLLRRAMSHFDPGKQMQTLQEKFIAGALEHSGVPYDTGLRIWELMAAFAGYGFPKAHAASYAQVSWRAAWCKLHYPAVFMAAVLANWGGYYSQRIYLTEVRRMGLELRSPEVNYAEREFTVKHIGKKPALFVGLDQVKELTQRTIGRIIEKRPFQSFDDFLARVDPRPVEAQNLVQTCALEEFGTVPALLKRLEVGGWQGGQSSFFSLGGETSDEDWTVEQKVEAQEKLLGASIVAHPLELANVKAVSSGTVTTVDASLYIGRHIRVIGMRQYWRRVYTVRGDFIYFMSLEDLEGMLEVVITGGVYRRWKEELKDAGPYIIEGLVEFNEERLEPFVRADRITRIR